ncbi:MAG: hypothetical protein ABS42_00080 [Bdellovibrio sp. SCN 50-8]|nr:MAG: hypothetical protein ABS42_00080 [Bdellovibrio sp. SCN 50-8]
MPVPSTTSRPLLRNSGGQGVVEYILLIVVVIAIALAVSARLFQPFNDWAKNYIGDYIYCLLDQGELPALGGEEAVSECDKNFQNYTFGGGRAPKGGEGGSGSAEANKGARSRLGNKDSGGEGGGGGGGGRRGRRSSSIGSGFDGAGGSGSSKVTEVGDAATGRTRRVVRINGRGGQYGSSNRTEVTGGFGSMMAQERERIKKREDKVRAVARASDSTNDFVRGKSKITTVEARAKKQSDLDLTAGDWSFGGIIRIALILAIIIALVLFIGGQLMQISKSMEKE